MRPEEDADTMRLEEALDDERLRLVADPGDLREVAVVLGLRCRASERDYAPTHQT